VNVFLPQVANSTHIMDLLKLEQQRQALETNLQKLRQTLKHWQLWEAEYEGLKEEILSAEDDLDAAGFTRIAHTYGGDLVNDKEIRELAALDGDSPRSAKHVIGLIERRQEYVQKNIETVQRQFFDAEAKQEELAFAAATQGGASDAGLPLTEIQEELDDDGNVISSRLTKPEEATTKAIEDLKKAGLTDKDLEDVPKELKPAITHIDPVYASSSITVDKRSHSEAVPASPSGDGSHDEAERPAFRKKSVSFTADTKAPLERPRSLSRDGKKSVSFNDKVAVMPAAPPPDNRSVSFSAQVEEIPASPEGPRSPNVQPLSSDEVEKARALMAAGDEATDASESDMATAQEVTLPEDESPEDARLRREMLDYHLNEVGNVVAQMDLDEDGMDYDDDDDDAGSFHTTSEYPEDDDTPYTTGLSESDESEDDSGRSKHRQLTPEYRKQMEELQQRLIGNLGPTPQDEDVTGADPDLDPKDVRKLVIRDNKRNSTSSASSESSEKKSSTKKRVSFAEELDVAEPGSPPLKAQKHHDGENVTPVTETIAERTTASAGPLPDSASAKNLSRFKKNRATLSTSSTDDPTSSPPTTAGSANTASSEDNLPLRTTLLERPVTKTTTASAPSLDDSDTVTQRRELAEAYYSRRNKLIQQQGGFKANEDEDDEMGELMEELDDGRLRKVSRFKAARIQGQ